MKRENLKKDKPENKHSVKNILKRNNQNQDDSEKGKSDESEKGHFWK